MAAHPDIFQSHLDRIIPWIFSLSNKESAKKSLPQAGNIIPSLGINVGSNNLLIKDLSFEIKLDTPDGKLIGKVLVKTSNKKSKEEITHIIIELVTDNNFHNLYFVYKPINKDAKIQAVIFSVKFNAR